MSGPLSFRNPSVHRLRRLLGRRSARRDEGAFVLEGPNLVAEALRSGTPVEVVAIAEGTRGEAADLAEQAAAAGAHRLVLAEGVLERVASTRTPQPILAVVRLPAPAALPPAASFVVVAVDLNDPGNAGALLRTAEAAGADAVVLCGEAIDPFGPKAVRASAGSVLRLPVVERGDPLETLEEMRAAGLRRVGALAAGGAPPDQADLTVALALVLGGEAHGLAPEVVAHLDERVTIPMAGPTESLNVTAAAAVLCFEVARQRRR